MMKLNERALAWSLAAVWGGMALIIGLFNLRSADYGAGMLAALGSIYPGYHAARSLDGVLILTGYAIAHGAAAGWCLARAYNTWSK